MKQLEKAHVTQMKNLKSVILAEAVKYFKQSSLSINKLLTREHHKIVKQFIAFKERVANETEAAEKYMQTVKEAEQEGALVNPVLEAFYNSRKEEPSKLYQCLMPTIIDVQKPKPERKRKYAMPDGQSDAEEVDVRDYESCSDSDSVNYRRALA